MKRFVLLFLAILCMILIGIAFAAAVPIAANDHSPPGLTVQSPSAVMPLVLEQIVPQTLLTIMDDSESNVLIMYEPWSALVPVARSGSSTMRNSNTRPNNDNMLNPLALQRRTPARMERMSHFECSSLDA